MNNPLSTLYIHENIGYNSHHANEHLVISSIKVYINGQPSIFAHILETQVKMCLIRLPDLYPQ